MFSWLKKYFIPHEKNGYKPHFLRHESALVILLLVTVVELCFLVQVLVVFDKTSFLASVLPGVLTTLTNEERAQNNVPPLTENTLLDKAAQLKANDMASKGYFAHTSPEGLTPWYWFDQVGYNYQMAGENLAVNFFESKDVAEAWMASPTHRANIVKPNYTEIGIGVANGMYEGRNTVFVAQLFGTQMPAFNNSNNQPAPTKPTATAPAKTATPKAPLKPKVPNATPKPPTTLTSTAPKTTKVATAPTAVRVLGEETSSTIVVAQDQTAFSVIQSFVKKIATSPREYVTYFYAGIIFIITLALMLAILVKSKIQHPAMITRGLGIVAVVLFLLFINLKVLHLDTQVPTDGEGASVISSVAY